MAGPNEETIGAEPAPSQQPLEGGEEMDSHPMDALLESESYELEMPRRGEIRRGTIARVTENDVLVDVGAKSEGIISARELERLSEERQAELTVGQEVDVYVVHSGGQNGTLVLSVVRAEEEQDWRRVEQLLESQEMYEGVISGYNKGGLIIKLGRLRGFIPTSQVNLSRRRRAQGDTPDKRWGKMVGESIMAKVIEVDRRRNRLILSERMAAREARDALKERLITELQPGEIRTGHVISLADFGAFVDIGGADGLVHMSEISWKRVAHPRDLLKVGQEVEVKVLGVDPKRRRISLSLRELESDPWESITEQYHEGQLVEGTITKLTKFGAFASLIGTEEYDIEGLIHISELSDQRIEHPREVVQEGQTLALRIIKIDRKRRRIGLSLKRVDSAEYAEQDWQAAMQDIAELREEGIGVGLSEEVEDFDAELEAEVSTGDEGEVTAEEVAVATGAETPMAEVAEADESKVEVEELVEVVEEEAAKADEVEEQPVEALEVSEPLEQVEEITEVMNPEALEAETTEIMEEEVVETGEVEELPAEAIEVSEPLELTEGIIEAVNSEPLETEVAEIIEPGIVEEQAVEVEGPVATQDEVNVSDQVEAPDTGEETPSAVESEFEDPGGGEAEAE